MGGGRWCMGGVMWCVGGVWINAYYSRLACMYTRVVYFAISEASGVALPKGNAVTRVDKHLVCSWASSAVRVVA
jgi:hypothetical protein